MSLSINELLGYSKALHVLYVEDNEDARKFTLEMLSRFFDDITIACDGEEGIEKFKEGKFDLVLTDINMPRMNGIELISQIKPLDDQVPILVLSAHNESGFYDEVSALGVQGYLAKPLALKQLIDTLMELFNKTVE